MSARSSIDQAIEHHINGQLDQALGLYVQALQEDPQTPGAADLISAILRTYLELALALMKTGRDPGSHPELSARPGHPTR